MTSGKAIWVKRSPAGRLRPLYGLPKVLARAGDLEVRLATSRREIRCAQKLRYRVFFEEGGAVADSTTRVLGQDVCRFDKVADHLIVVDNAVTRLDGSPTVVGAYRLLRQEVAQAYFGFYSAAEFEIGALVARHPEKRFLELGRSCVADAYRGKRTLELLWRGIWAYALHHGVDVMFGCASLPGACAQQHAAALAFLRVGSLASDIWDVGAVSGRAAPPVGAEPQVSPRNLLRALPPLIKGYWRVGAKFSRDAVVDAAFGVTDVLVVMPVADIRARYLSFFAPSPQGADLAA